jgi:glutathione synthase/RimK-type ligase-like ATP-grasp enzyme
MNNQEALERARLLAHGGDDPGARQAYIEVLRQDPTNFCALTELGNLALEGGYRSAAITAFREAVHHYPTNKIAHAGLANALRENRDFPEARFHYQAALDIDPDFAVAHRGMASVLGALGLPGAEHHRDRGFSGHSLVTKPYRGSGAGSSLLMLVSALGGNIPTRLFLDDRRFTTHTIYAEYYDATLPLPPHRLVLNAIGDAELCANALDRAERLIEGSSSPVINQPARVRATARADNAQRLSNIPGVTAPRVEVTTRDALLANGPREFPVLIRSPGFHTGQHFVRVDEPGALAPAIASLAGEKLLEIQYLDARGADGMARKYRVMFVDGAPYPLHLAISSDWKVHYFTADMARSASFREEERRFLEDMPSVLGASAMRALERIRAVLGLEYAGIDFALAQDGSVLLFEANATMNVLPPGAEPMWDYRRAAVEAVVEACKRLLAQFAGHTTPRTEPVQ